MRRGCISMGNVRCDQCGRDIPYPQRYLVLDEENGIEVENGHPVRYCVECALQKGYAHYKKEKGEEILTFLPEPEVGQG